jgi:hypothetical protein
MELLRLFQGWCFVSNVLNLGVFCLRNCSEMEVLCKHEIKRTISFDSIDLLLFTGISSISYKIKFLDSYFLDDSAGKGRDAETRAFSQLGELDPMDLAVGKTE